MKFIPNLFMPDMAFQIGAGNKTMTSRIITKKNSTVGSYPCKYGDEEVGWNSFDFTDVVFDGKNFDRQYIKVLAPIDNTRHRIYPKADPGDIIWVRESGWVDNNYMPGLNEPHLYWRADYEKYEDFVKVLIKDHTCPFPNIHMPKVFCRYFLKIIKIKAAKANDITREEAVMEGMCFTTNKPKWIQEHRFPEENFEILWKKLHGPESWNNDLVWRYIYERIELTPDQRTEFLENKTSKKVA